MTVERPRFSQLRSRLKARDSLIGTFVKMPPSQAIEIFGAVGFDYVVIDAEHAPLDRAAIDLMVLGARSAEVAPVVRVGHAGEILTALDCGAMGVMVPHVRSAAEAREVARACRYANGTRGFAGLTRASGWGARNGVQHMAAQDDQIACIAMIEDVEAVDLADEIAATPGIDAIFVGRGDLTASFGDDPEASAKVARLTERIAAACGRTGTPLMMLATSTADAATVRGLGATAILVSSDHGFLKSAAAAAMKDFAAPGKAG